MIVIGRDNSVKLVLLANGREVEPNTITRATLSIKGRISIELDTDIDSELELIDDAKIVLIRDGPKLDGITDSSTFMCYLFCYDAEHPKGIAWSKFRLNFERW